MLNSIVTAALYWFSISNKRQQTETVGALGRLTISLLRIINDPMKWKTLSISTSYRLPKTLPPATYLTDFISLKTINKNITLLHRRKWNVLFGKIPFSNSTSESNWIHIQIPVFDCVQVNKNHFVCNRKFEFSLVCKCEPD